MLFRFHVLAAVLTLVGCTEPAPLYPPSAPPEVVAACAVTERRCSECHDRDRIVTARKSPQEWASTVDRMRQMPGSTIRPDETEVILRCLRYHDDMSAPESRRDVTRLFATQP